MARPHTPRHVSRAERLLRITEDPRLDRVLRRKGVRREGAAHRKTPELDLQVEVVRFLALATVKGEALFWFVPNGANNQSKAQRGRFKAAGLTKGVPDLHFIWAVDAGPDHPARYGVIEMKRPGKQGKATADQTAFLATVADLGHESAVCRSVEEVEQVLRRWGYPLRARFT